ncbi:hypothetical protein Tco_0283174 [Tanacetum coccineum]
MTMDKLPKNAIGQLILTKADVEKVVDVADWKVLATKEKKKAQATKADTRKKKTYKRYDLQASSRDEENKGELQELFRGVPQEIVHDTVKETTKASIGKLVEPEPVVDQTEKIAECLDLEWDEYDVTRSGDSTLE